MTITPLTIGPYRILRPLGEGAGGQTFLAEKEKGPSRWVALKRLRPSQAQDFSRAAFLQEAALLKELDHPHLARLLDFGETETGPYFVTEFIEGTDLVNEAKTRDWNAVFALMVQTAWVLEYLHSRNIWHRDIKPANLLVGRIHDPTLLQSQNRLHLKLIDLGAALRAGAHLPSPPRAGTLAYMAPEVLSGSPYDHRADLYSLGLVFYEMAWGRLPFAKTRSFTQYLGQLTEGKVDLSPLKDSPTPPGVYRVIKGLLVADPARRIARALDIVEILNDAEGENFPRQPAPLSGTFISSAPNRIRHTVKISPDQTPKNILTRIQDLSRQGKKGEAWDWAEAALPLSEKWKDPSVVEEFLTQVVHLLAEQGQYAKAEPWRERMLHHPALAGERPLEYFLTGIYLNFRQGRHDEARNLLANLPSDLRESAPPDKKSRIENYWGMLEQTEGHWEAAAEHYQNAARHAQASGRRDHRATFLSNAASLYFQKNRWQRAFDLFQEALEQAREISSPSLVASIQNNLANLFLYFGRFSEAESALSESLEQAQSLGLKPLIAYDLYLMTQVEEGRGNRERVEAYLNRALDFAEELGDAQPILQARLAKVRWELNQDSKTFDEKSLDDLESLTEKTGLTWYGLQARHLRAKYLLKQKKLNDPRVLEAFAHYRNEVEKRGSPMLLWPLLMDEGDWASARGHRQEAEAKYREALGIIEKLKQEVPEAYRESFFRDRKKEQLLEKLRPFQSQKQATGPMNPPSPGSDRVSAGPHRPVKTWMELNRRILMHHRVEPMLEEILDAALELTGAERGFILLEEQGEVKVKAARHLHPDSLHTTNEGRFSYTVAREVLRRGRSRIVLDAQGDSLFSEAQSVMALGIRSLMCVPLKTPLGTVGLIYLDNRFREGVFHSEQLPELEAFADQASLALEHARLFQENERTIHQLEDSKKLIERLNRQLEKDLEETSATLQATQEGLRRQNEERALRVKYDKIIGSSEAITRVLKTLDRIVSTDINVFIFGESGTGKELIAQAIHFNSPRRSQPFVAENCAALSEHLLESELFGHVKGAFSGANDHKVGLFEAANGGTVFLDEVGDMPPNLQAKLLRVLQEGTVRRLGSNDYRKVNVRVVSASNKDLKRLVEQGDFRQDLYFRLNVMRLELPPLRNRSEDIPLLAEFFLKRVSEEEGSPTRRRFSPETLKILMDYSWPGNIRELQNEIRRMTALATGSTLGPDLLSPHLRETEGPPFAEAALNPKVASLEKEAIVKALTLTEGNKVKAAKQLHIARRTLYLKMKQYGIDPQYGKPK